MRDFSEKVVLITGGSSGIGLALARQLAAQGARVGIVGRSQEKLDAALAELASMDGNSPDRFLAIAADVADAAQAVHAVQKITASLGLPDLVINSAGVVRPGYIDQLSLEHLHESMDINYFGTVHIVKAVTPGMLARGSGTIVNISSGLGLVAFIGYSAYCATKFALRGFTDAIRAELKPHGIDVSIVFPPDTDTPGLQEELRVSPPEYRAVAGSFSLQPADKVAAEILKGVRRRRYLIFPSADMRLIYWLTNTLGGGLYPLVDWLVSYAYRKTGRPAGAVKK